MVEFNPDVTAKAVSPYGDGDEKQKGDSITAKPIEIKFGEGNGGASTAVSGTAGQREINYWGSGGEDKKFNGATTPQMPTTSTTEQNNGGLQNNNLNGGFVQQNNIVIVNNNVPEVKSDSKNTNYAEPNKKTDGKKKVNPKPTPKPEPQPAPLPEKLPEKPQEPVRINEHFNAAEVRAASHGPGTNEKRFIKAVTYGPYEVTNYKEILKRKPLNKAEVKALDEEIRNQTAGEKSLLKLMEEEFNIQGGLFRSNNKISRLYDLYSEYLSDDSDEKG